MRRARPLLPLLAAAVALAGCAQEGESNAPAESPDPDLLARQYVDLTAPVAADCAGADARDVPPARFDVPADARWARVEGTFEGGRVGLEVSREEDGRRLGFAAAGSPVVVELEEPTLEGARTLAVRAFACEGDETRVRVYATFRRAAG